MLSIRALPSGHTGTVWTDVWKALGLRNTHVLSRVPRRPVHPVRRDGGADMLLWTGRSRQGMWHGRKRCEKHRRRPTIHVWGHVWTPTCMRQPHVCPPVSRWTLWRMRAVAHQGQQLPVWQDPRVSARAAADIVSRRRAHVRPCVQQITGVRRWAQDRPPLRPGVSHGPVCRVPQHVHRGVCVWRHERRRAVRGPGRR